MGNLRNLTWLAAFAQSSFHSKTPISPSPFSDIVHKFGMDTYCRGYCQIFSWTSPSSTPTGIELGRPPSALMRLSAGQETDIQPHEAPLIATGKKAWEAADDAECQPKKVTSLDTILPLVLLNVVTVLWGTQHAVIKLILESDLTPGVTNLARFFLAALIFSPWTPGLFLRPPALPFSPFPTTITEERGGEVFQTRTSVGVAETWLAGSELGLWMFLGFAFQAVGLGFTTASRSAFLLYLNVKLVPFFAFIILGRSISAQTWASAGVAFLGTALLSSDGTAPNVGDLWSIASAATSAMFILRLEKYSDSCNASQLNSANLWVTAGLCGLWAAWELGTGAADLSAALAGIHEQGALIAYLAVVTTALTNWLQALGQRSIPAERAAIIYAMDPVYAAGFAYAILGEKLGPVGLVGAACVFGAAILSQRSNQQEEGM
ncbi:unnamed protein product [Choristocarpus tenellus]